MLGNMIYANLIIVAVFQVWEWGQNVCGSLEIRLFCLFEQNQTVKVKLHE